MNYEITFTTFTDVFAGGAEIKNAELRPSEFRNGMRFWFRAMMGKFVGNNLSALHRLEDAAFGATDASSPFVIRLTILSPTGHQYQISPGTTLLLSQGKAYLGFPFYKWKSKGQNNLAEYELQRGYIPPGVTFKLSLRFKRPAQELENVILGALWLLVNFGGIGSRTRRGFGSVKATLIKKNEQKMPNILAPQGNPGEYYTGVYSLVTKWFQAFVSAQKEANIDFVMQEVTDYLSFHDWNARVVIRNSIETASDCLFHAGVLLRGVRNGTYITALQDLSTIAQKMRQTTSDYRDIISCCMDSDPSDDEWLEVNNFLNNDIFGLPQTYLSTSRGGQQLSVSLKSRIMEGDGRRASPLILRPVPLPNGQVGILMAFFVSRFLPDEVGMSLRRTGHGRSPLVLQKPDPASIQTMADRFFKHVDNVYKPHPNNPNNQLIVLPPTP